MLTLDKTMEESFVDATSEQAEVPLGKPFVPKPQSRNLDKGLLAWIKKLARQSSALTLKNLKISLRNSTALLAQLWIGVIFLFLLLIIGAAIQASARDDTSFVDTKGHVDVNAPATFPSCVARDGRDCYSFAYASSLGPSFRNDTAIEAVIDQIATKLNVDPTRNVSGGIFAFSPLSLSSDIDQWILDNPNTTRAIIIFENSHQWTTIPASDFRYIYRYNETQNCREIFIYKCDQPWLEFHVPLISALNSAFIAGYGGSPDTSMSVSFSNFPHPDLPSAFNSMQQFGALFIYIAFTFNYVVLLTTIVREKELQLVESMRQMGMLNSAYWLSWILSATVINTIMVFLIMLFGVILRFELFVKTSGQLLLTILWLSAQAFTAIALFFSSFLRTTATARVIGVMVFIVTFIAAPLLYSAYYSDPTEDYNTARWVVAIFPFFTFYHAFQTTIDRSSGSLQNGMSWDDRFLNLLPPSASNVNPTYWSVNSSLEWLVASFFIFTLLAWYIEQIVPNEHGRRKRIWFLLQPSYWGFRLKRRAVSTTAADGDAPVFTPETDGDVREEANAISNNTVVPPPAVVLKGVTKVFGSWRKPFVAVNRVFYGMNYGHLTAILGHNGSGKSTTFNMLTGLSSVTSGTAEIFGSSVSDDMAELHASMGVCPQHDVLWDQLTAREHLELFARIKGLFGSIQDEAQTRLDQVKLASASNSQVKGYSGGMRRRLSIAIAMLGDPAIVFLDEPTTGMDPVTRREVLEMISESKRQDRVIVLTSHAMEEVEMLADKVVVMSRGNIQAIGTVVRLKKRFGLGYKMTMFGTTQSVMSDYVTTHWSSLGQFKVSQDEKDGAVYVNLPRTAETSELVPFLERFESDKVSLGVSDFSLSLSTLEEVFLNLSHSEEERDLQSRFKTDRMKARYEECERYQPKFVAKSKVSTFAQINALFWKNFTFQLRTPSFCCCSVLFPVLIMILLIVLDRVVFLPQKIKVLCGDNVAASDCATQGPDLVCAAKIVQFRQTVTLNTLDIGVIDLTGNRGAPVNGNCDTEVCFDDLEKMESRNFPVSYDPSVMDPTLVGYVNFTYNSDEAKKLFEWYSDLLFLIDAGNAKCQQDYDDQYSTDSCDNSTSDARQDCINDIRELTETQQYWEAQKQQTSNAFGIGACLRTNGAIKVPSANYTLLYNQIEQAKTTCQSHVTTNYLIPHFLSMNVTDALSSVSKSGEGLMNSFGLARFLNTDLLLINQELWDAVNSTGVLVFGSDGLYQTKRGLWFASIGVDPADYQFIPTVDQMCSAFIVEPDGNITQPFLNQLVLIMNGTDATRNLCASFASLDVLRGLSTQSFGEDRDSLDSDIYHSWFGTKEETALMDALSPVLLTKKDLYKQRQYLAKVSAMHFRNLSEQTMDVVIYHNKTAGSNDDTVNWVPLVHNAENAFVQSRINRQVFMRTQEMPLKFVCNRDAWLNDTSIHLECDLLPLLLQLSIIDFVAIQLFPFIFFTLAFLAVNQLVYEKEQKLRVIMRMNGGLKNSVYWIVLFAFFYIQFIFMSLLVYILGNIATLRFTSLHDPIIYWAFILSWGALMVVFAFFMSIFFASSQSSTAGVFLFVLITILVGVQILANIIQDPFTNESSYASLMWLPPFVMIRYVIWLGLAGGLNQKIYAYQFSTFADGALAICIGVMWAEFFACIILVWYLDNVYVAGFGTRKHPLFCLRRKYWTGENQGNTKPLNEYDVPEDIKQQLTTVDHDDVKAEHDRVVDESSPNLVVRIVRLHKRFENGFIALKSLSLGINENECFGLLGHNGAGKTTAISMLVGLYEPTSGTALVDGLSINTDMDAVQTRMGVCPQHDLCWGPLSVRDHLLFYARLKGVPSSELSIAVDKALFDVNLKQFESRASKKLSGGMRRRLSTAMSLIGTPRVVYLDEPSTGLDPASKRALWSVIAKAKGNKSLVLTTHSMEEAEALCDRIGIMALGELQCLGTAAQLKRRYGTGYTFYLAVNPAMCSDKQVFPYIDSLFGPGNARILGRGIGGTYKFEVDRQSVVLSRVFAQLESKEVRQRLSVLDWSLTETTLEEVFLKLADLAKVDEALSAHHAKVHQPAKKTCSSWSLCCRRQSTIADEKKDDGPAADDVAQVA